jgi:hypothetical protein
LQDSDLLQTIAEIATALAGFSGVVAFLGERARGEWRAVDLFRFNNLLTSSIAALLLSFVPILIFKLGASESTAWRCSSGLTAAVILIFMARGRAIRQLPEVEQVEMPRPSLLALAATLVATVALLVANAAGVAYPGESGPFLVGLVSLLALSAFQFVRLLLLLHTRGEGAG